jgi:hypothetical protein
MRQIPLAFFAAAALMQPVVSHAGWFGPDNYEDCMLAKMKGQNSGMYFTAHAACAKMFEQEIYRSIKTSWEYANGYITITIPEDSGYIVTKGQFSFASKNCGATTDDDFGAPKEIIFTSGKPLYKSISPPPICMKTLRLWGKLQ